MDESSAEHQRIIVGWMEWVTLPGLRLPSIEAKLDTGAATSSLHAENITEMDGNRVRFTMRPRVGSEDTLTVERDIHDRRTVKSSNGHTQERFVVLMKLQLAGRIILAETNITDRLQMKTRMLIGREVLRQGFLVDSSRSSFHQNLSVQ